MFALCDVNAFYVNCETVFRPDLWNKPVVVLSNNDGCVIARNAGTKALGVKMGDPWFEQEGLFHRYGATCSSSNYELYVNVGNRMMSILGELLPCIEIYSIDEAFCDLTGVYDYRDLTDFGRGVRATVLQRTHLIVGVGIVQTRALAKLVNYTAKKWQRQTGGAVGLSNLGRQHKLMPVLPVDDVWGTGRRISKRLSTMRIKTVLDLADTDIRFIRKHFNVMLERMVRGSRDEPYLQLEGFTPTEQETICSRSSDERITNYPSTRQVICSYVARAAEKLRSEHQYYRFISIFIKTSLFVLNEPYYGNSASVKLLTPTQDSKDIINAVTRSLDAIWQAGRRYQEAGMMLRDLFSQGVAQLSLFDDNASRPGSEQSMTIMGTLDAKEGGGTLYSTGRGIQQQWQMKHAMPSPRYTTRSPDLLRVR